MQRFFKLTLILALALTPLFYCSTPVLDEIPATPASEDFSRGKALYDQKNYKEAFPYLQRAANNGNAEAQMRLGKMYFNGWGVPHSHDIAREWHEKAAAQGNAESIEKLKKFTH